jgi:hypothetical protein
MENIEIADAIILAVRSAYGLPWGTPENTAF